MEPDGYPKAAAFTGPRPEKLPLKATRAAVEAALKQAIFDSVDAGYEIFISGGCRGVDLWAAQQVLALRQDFSLKLAVFVPFRNQAGGWGPADRAEYNQTLQSANWVKVLSDHFYRGAYYNRNRIMLEHSDRLIAVCGAETAGGTGHTVGLARMMGHKIIRIDPETL